MADEDAEVAATARDALGQLTAVDIDQEIAEILNKQQEDLLPAAIEVARQRKVSAATPGLFMLVDSRDQAVGLAALEALGSTIELKELPRILERVFESQGAQREAAIKALGAACARLPRESCTGLMAEALPDAKVDNQIIILEQLTAVGGETALATVAEMARSSRDELQDAATRLLGTWPTSDVAKVLEELSGSLTQRKYRVRTLRGYLRVARQLDLPTEERIEICRRALLAAERPEEMQLAVEILQRYPTASGVAVASTLLSDPRLETAAFNALMEIGVEVRGTQPLELSEALNRVLKQPLSLSQQQQVLDLMVSAQGVAQQKEQTTGFAPLFDGKTLAGWHGNTDIFRVENGEIVGGNLKDKVPQNEFLRTDKTYGDFELRLQFKLLGASPNAGVQIRTKEIPGDHEVSGYQADLGPGWWGCLYDESRRNRVLAGPTAEKRGEPVRENEWNDYRILCEGPRIRLWVNGVPTVDYTEMDESIPLQGIIAVQVHAGEPMEARYRNLRIREIK